MAVSPDGLYVASWSGLYFVKDGQTTKLDQSKSFLSRNVSSLAVDNEGAVWIGSRAGIDVARGEQHLRSLTPKEGLPSTDVRSLAFDANGRLWIGTELGMVRYDGKRWSLRHSLRWLPHDETRDVAFGEDGTVWVATAGGISPIKVRTMTLDEKAAFFLKLARDRHVRAPGLVEKCRLAVPGDLSSHEPMDTDNDGSYTGLYLVAECYRFAVTGAEDAKQNAMQTYRALEFLQTVTETDGFVARTVIPADWTHMADANRTYTPQQAAAQYAGDVRWKQVEERWRLSADKKWLWKGDTSSDEISGHFFAYGVYYDLVADENEKQRVAKLVRKLMDYLIEGGYNLRDIDGKHTRWGVWSPEKLNGDPNWWLERGCNSVELLSFLTVAKHVTGDPKYDREIENLLTEHHFAENILTPMSPYNDYFTYIGYELLAMSYPALLTFEKDPQRRALYLKSLEKWFEPVRKDASLFYSFVYAAQSGGKIRTNRCAEMLRDMPLDQIRWRIDNSRREDLRLVHRPTEDALQLNRLLPASERPVFRWDRNVYDAVNGDGGRTEGCAVVWLMPYWMGRHYGLIKPPKAN